MKLGNIKSNYMVRAVSLTAMAGGFLWISPQLRSSLLDCYTQVGDLLETHSPYSYVMVGVVALGAFMMFIHRSAQPR